MDTTRILIELSKDRSKVKDVLVNGQSVAWRPGIGDKNQLVIEMVK